MKLLIKFILLVAFVTSCKKSHLPVPVPGNQVDIYIAGIRGGEFIPFYMKNGEYFGLPVQENVTESILLNDFQVKNKKINAAYGSLYENVDSYYSVNDEIFDIDNFTHEKLLFKNNDILIGGTNKVDLYTKIYKNGELLLKLPRYGKVRNLVSAGNDLYVGYEYSTSYCTHSRIRFL